MPVQKSKRINMAAENPETKQKSPRALRIGKRKPKRKGNRAKLLRNLTARILQNLCPVKNLNLEVPTRLLALPKAAAAAVHHDTVLLARHPAPRSTIKFLLVSTP